MLDHNDGSSRRSVLHGSRSRRAKEANSAEHNQRRQSQQRQPFQETAHSTKTTDRSGNRAQKLAALSLKNALHARRLRTRNRLHIRSYRANRRLNRSSGGRNGGSMGRLSHLRGTGCMSRARRANRLRRCRHTRTPLCGAGGRGAGGVKYHQTCRKVCRSATRSNRCCSSHCGSFLSARPGVTPRV